MTLRILIFLLAMLYVLNGCNSRLVLTHKADKGDTTAILNLAYKLYSGRDYNNLFFARRLFLKTTKPLEAIKYLEKGVALNSINASNRLHDIKNDSFIIWHKYDVLWYYDKKLLVINNDYNTIIKHDKSLLAIASEVRTLIVINPNGSVEDKNKYQMINHSNYKMYSNVDTLIWVGDDYDYINEVPENALGLTSLKQLYILNISIDSTISKQFYSFNPALKIEHFNTYTIDKRLSKLISYAYPH